MMINYKALSGTEIQYWQGQIYFWIGNGVYSFRAASLHKHNRVQESREVTFWFLDLNNGYRGTCKEMFDESFDDMEIIQRFISGTGKCDCVRGKMLYGSDGAIPGSEVAYSCNKKDNRFILQKMVIKGEDLNCVVKYKGYM